MTDIRYIAVSDLHLGASNSLLTRPGDGTDIDTRSPSTVMLLLVECLRELVAGNAGGRLPTLIAHGDLIDLALSGPERAITVFGQFTAALLAPGHAAIDSEVVLLPGNHDHLVWDYTRERWLEDHLFEVMHGDPPAGFTSSRRISPLLLDAEPRFESALLCALSRRRPELADLRVRVLYPDLVLASPGDGKAVLLTHGQYIESTSKAMSAFLRMIAPHIPPPADVATMEEENWPWLDFFFSSMTRSGKPGALIAGIYDVAQDSHDLDTLVDVVATNVTVHSGRAVGALERFGIRRGVGMVVDRLAAARERGVTNELLTGDTRQGLATYLEALRGRLRVDLPRLPAETSLIIGHTHKPLHEWWPDERWPGGGVRVFNTGGWVVDHAEGQPLMGGAIALVSDELDVCLVRLYQQIHEPADWGITVDTVTPSPAAEAFAVHVRSLIHPDQAPWRSFSASAASAVLSRRERMAHVLEDNLGPLRG